MKLKDKFQLDGLWEIALPGEIDTENYVICIFFITFALIVIVIQLEFLFQLLRLEMAL